jgi:hypothetical protein
MSAERLRHIVDQLESGTTIGPASAEWLRQALRRHLDQGEPLDQSLGLASRDLRAERDAIIRDGAESLGFTSIKARARLIASESQRLRSGRRSEYLWIIRADRIYPLPETERMFEIILR